MRVGVLTYHFSENFGALMQAYGLRQWLLQRGVAAEFINYHPRHVEAGGIQFSRGAKAFAKSVFLAASEAKGRIFGNRAQASAFKTFQQDILGVQGPRYETAESLESIGKFDLIICGSDQIWNPSVQRGLDPVYFAQFPGAERARRISYAASFGKSELEGQYQLQAAGLIRAMDAISVRESSGVAIVNALVHQAPIMVPDPTILLNDFSELIAANPTQSTGHVFCYALRTPEGVREAAHLAAAQTNGKILSPDNPHRRWREIGSTVYPSPGEWLSLLNNASVVVTNSFHGVALSLLLRKRFVSIALPGQRAGFSERARNLLRQVGLEDRLIEPGDKAGILRALSDPIDWEMVHNNLEIMSASGRDYLDVQLSRVRSAT